MKNTLIVIIALSLFFAYSCKDEAAIAELEKQKAQLELLEQNKAVAERWHKDLTVDRNWAVAEEILAPDIVIHNPGAEDMKGIEQVKMLDETWKSLPNVKITNHEIIAEGDYVLIRWDVSFDHTVDLMGIPASGNHVSGIYGMDLFLVKEGKITDLWQSWDQLGFMQQTGAIPAPQ
ncbi:MAG: ester cyclase [Bacteroidota bacterium]